MLFSIIVPVYQAENDLPECLISIENQMCQDFEVVLIDDGSKDGSGVICDAFAKKHPEHVTVIHKENEGQLAARLAGIQVAHGQYCVFLDSDDLLTASCLEVLREKLHKFDYPDLILYRFSYYENGKIRPCTYRDFGAEQLFCGTEKKTIYEHYIQTSELNSMCSKVVSTALLQSDTTQYEVYYSRRIAEDALQSLYLLTHANRILYINDALYLYRYNQFSTSRRHSFDGLEKKNCAFLYAAIQVYLPQWDLMTQEIQQSLFLKWVGETRYMQEQYFASASGLTEKWKVIRYPWKTFYPQAITTVNQEKIPRDYRRIWQYTMRERYLPLFLLLYIRLLWRKAKRYKRRIVKKSDSLQRH